MIFHEWAQNASVPSTSHLHNNISISNLEIPSNVATPTAIDGIDVERE